MAPSQDPPLLPVVPGQVAEKAETMGESSPQSANRDGNKNVRFLVNKTQGGFQSFLTIFLFIFSFFWGDERDFGK